MLDYELTSTRIGQEATFYRPLRQGPSPVFLVAKRGFDLWFSVMLLPLLCVTSVMLLLLNPFFNSGPVFFAQIRMGRHCRPFLAYKFRSMSPRQRALRGPFDPLEADRIPALGRFIRRSRLDELPQILNVIKGEMSLIGPRPDYVGHARHYNRTMPGYRSRHSVRPGISGLAQTEIGYVQCADTVQAKVQADLRYIRTMGPMQEIRIFWRTILTVLCLKGQ
ncbi:MULTISPECIES: sugar transferase [unclassified Ruegeria]|uniref:sugar transferase n=1 Tax=unclassified Ruegeria TaxID=2625375 RepID=UPI001489B521|nr:MULTISPECIES: sugar transferase [unclassified Ruegeria]